MTVERIVNPATGATKEIIRLTDEENAALDKAHEIIKIRAKAENAEYDQESIEWWLLGILRSDESGAPRSSDEEGIAAILEKASHTPFHKQQIVCRGYA